MTLCLWMHAISYWQYDVKAIHDGERNNYVITKQGRKYQMDPLVEPSEEKQVGSSVMLLSDKDFLNIMKKEKRLYYAVIVKPKEKTKEKIIMPQEV